MKNKEIIMGLRTQRKLKGKRPLIVSVDKNYGNIYPYKKSKTFILSIDDEFLYFQYITRFLKIYDESYDFQVKLCDLSSYIITQKLGGAINTVTLYDKFKNFLPFKYILLGKEGHQTNVSITYIFDQFKNKKIRYESNNFGDKNEKK